MALGIAGGLLLADASRAIIGDLSGLLITLLISIFLSFAMEPAVAWLQGRGMRRGFATGLIFLGALLAMAGFVAAMAPLIVGQVSNLVDNGPEVLDNLAEQAQRLPGDLGPRVSEWLDGQQAALPERIPSVAGAIGRSLAKAGTTVLGGIIQGLTILLVTFYLVADGPKVRQAMLRRLKPNRQRELLHTWDVAIAKTGGYVYSRALTAITSAGFHIVAFTMIGVPYPIALGVWVGLISSLVPVIGTYIAGGLPLVIALAHKPVDALWVLMAIVVYQQVENYLVAPRITARTMELHPAVAFVSVLAGASLLGAVGALLALPAAAIVTALFSAYGEIHEVVSQEASPGPPAPATAS